MSSKKSYLTDEVKALISVKGERVQVSPWGIEKEGLRRFCQALMDPDPRSWDEDFARTTRYGEIVTPAIYCTYSGRQTPAADDPITKAFKENPVSDGIGGVRSSRGSLPSVPTELKRVLNAGNGIELLRYPSLGDIIYSQASYADITEREGRDGSRMLIITTETVYTNQDGETLCITRASSIRR